MKQFVPVSICSEPMLLNCMAPPNSAEPEKKRSFQHLLGCASVDAVIQSCIRYLIRVPRDANFIFLRRRVANTVNTSLLIFYQFITLQSPSW